MFGTAALTEEVVRDAVAGSAQQRDRVLKAVFEQIPVMVLGRLGPWRAEDHDIEDVSQDVCVAVTERVSGLRVPTVDGLRAFMSGIVRKKAADWVRRRGRARGRKIVSLDRSISKSSTSGPMWQFLAGSSAGPLTKAGQNEQVEIVLDELARMPIRQRNAIVLAFFDQLKTRQIGVVFGITREAAGELLKRAMVTVRSRVRSSAGTGTLQDARI